MLLHKVVWPMCLLIFSKTTYPRCQRESKSGAERERAMHEQLTF
jgi:hypothetical protein